MNVIAMLLGYGVMVYLAIVGLVMLFTKCSFEDAREKVASFFKENEYELCRSKKEQCKRTVEEKENYHV